MRYLIFITLFISVFSQEKINLGSKPDKITAFTLTEIKKLTDKEGYYKRVFADYNAKGELVVADAGNKRILIYDKDFNLKYEFGEEGNGPEEIDDIFLLELIDDRIIIQGMRNFKVFDYKGNFISSINNMEYGFGEFLVLDEKIVRVFNGDKNKYKRVYYDKDGNEIKKVENKDYIEENENSRMRVMFIGGAGAEKYNGYIAKKPDEKAYTINLLNDNFKVEKILYRDFVPVKRDFSRFQFNFNVRGVSKKEAAKMKAEAEQRMKKQMGEYEADVQRILGDYNGYLLVRTACEKMSNNLQMDIIKDDKLYSVYKQEFEDEIEFIKLKNGRIIISFRNEEDGPYLKIFEPAIN